MLARLTIANLATIRSLSIEFEQGFTVLTGETGAGKSILIDAIRFVLGAKADAEQIRSGEGQTTVEATFRFSGLAEVETLLSDLGIPAEGELVLRRTLHGTGRSRAVANDCTISQPNLEKLAAYLVNIHGQHDNQLLLNPETHQDFLDAFGGLGNLKAEVESGHRDYTRLLRERKALKDLAEQREERRGELARQMEEIGSAALSPGEEEGLRQDHARLSNLETLTRLTGGARENLYEGENSLLARLAQLTLELKQAAAIDERLAGTVAQVEPLRFQLEDLYRTLGDYTARLEADPGELDRINARLAEIEKIKRRYGGSIAAALELLMENERELGVLERADTTAAELDEQIGAVAGRLHDFSRRLSEGRKGAATDLDRLITDQLRTLGMEKAIFETRIKPLSNSAGQTPFYTAKGTERVDFQLTTNPGQKLRPLSRIASGGELSRIMLALKSILAKTDPTRTLIFDEVDAGIGGSLAEIVGTELRGLGESHQVLCVTHLPQIAAMSTGHLRVTKEITGGETFTRAAALSEPERVQEVARMLSGFKVSDTSLASAQEMVNRGRQAPI